MSAIAETSETTVPEIIDSVFAKTSPKRSFSMTEYERFGLVFMKTRVYKFGHRDASYSMAENKNRDARKASNL